ncbi:MAG: TetR/AcrR family transcriptional regulator [Eubacteriales bacterium]
MNETRERIVSAAIELFEKKGFAAATTKEIADLAKVSEITLFRHFESKRNLFDQAIRGSMRQYRVRDYLKNNVTYDLDRDLTAIAYHMMETYKQNSPLLRMIMRDMIRGSVPEMDIKHNEYCLKNNLIEYFSAMKEKGKLDADPKMAVKFFVTNITGYYMREFFAKNDHEKDENKYFDWMLKKVISVLKP